VKVTPETGVARPFHIECHDHAHSYEVAWRDTPDGPVVTDLRVTSPDGTPITVSSLRRIDPDRLARAAASNNEELQWLEATRDRMRSAFEAKFGEPSDREKKRRSLLANRHKPNLILRWESHNESDGRTTILEIRNFDDIRNRIPDTDVSVVRVFDDNSKEIFDTLSDRVFLLRRGAGEFRPGEPTTRTKTLN